MGCSRLLPPRSSCSPHRVPAAPATAADEDRTKTATEAVAISRRHHHHPARATAGLVDANTGVARRPYADTGGARRPYSNIGPRVVTSSSA